MTERAASEVRRRWGEDLRLERHRRRLTQHAVAEKAGMRSATVCRAERGRGSVDTFVAIAAALEVPLAAFDPDEAA